MTAPDFNSTRVRADTVIGKVYTEAEVQALLAAQMEEAAKSCDRIAGNAKAFNHYTRRAAGMCAAAIRAEMGGK